MHALVGRGKVVVDDATVKVDRVRVRLGPGSDSSARGDDDEAVDVVVSFSTAPLGSGAVSVVSPPPVTGKQRSVAIGVCSLAFVSTSFT